MNQFGKQVALQQAKALEFLLPQTCRVEPATGENLVISATGVETYDDPVPRTYKGSPDIPCRIDYSRAFRPGNLPEQVTAVDEFVAHFPFDFTFQETDYVFVDGERYVIRKTNTVSVWNVTQEAVIGQLGVNQDV